MAKQRQSIQGGGDVVLASATPVTIIAPLNYDYGSIDEDVRDDVIDAVHAIRDNYHDADVAYRQAHAGIVETGRKLHYLKDTVPHGQFEAIVEAEFPFNVRQARNIMAGYDLTRQLEAQGKSAIISVFTPTALNLLAAPSVPESAVQAAVQEAEETGKAPTVARTKAIIAEARDLASVDDMVPTVEEWLESYAGSDANAEGLVQILDDVLNTGRESIKRNSLYTDLNNAHGIGGWQWGTARRAVERVNLRLTVERDAQQDVGQSSPHVGQIDPPAHQQPRNGVEPRNGPPAQPQAPVVGINTDGDAYRTVTLQLSGELCEWLDDLVADNDIPYRLQDEYEATIGRVAREFAASETQPEPEPAELTDWRHGWTDADTAEYNEVTIAAEWYVDDITRFRVALRLAETEQDKGFRDMLIDHAEELEHDGVAV